ncbi:uncharacterized protein LOC128258562 [Drosophila gunungcola]|uniref:uncharacterized protein LOC128258562 n=1 Tax=Drosophila gunungcola TaxID=103775 RepID=UPI0022E56E75|nr:uncharacterized protein LOC128258562 [Drosophila gunungcola]XP_052846205.1 uncharacterized protein LOC128258562 [Drosophila gunungcola]XP_052846214.1 uncharacterized protein LOC128258562 [Drosophila gunungcola]XP_052846222.1 uncharacterized protein LOC128258562 [Drosophila gunungcola]XP_052846231.1 uncharacterized protein LOC128258562 [Drosophila gunungcola]XP_052846239.1 uncharacterized protein LOC128258562 [Drosophila gunungcola]XP_052846248.1 uncharacterized protein LOC128258562 [Drosop
MIQILAHRPNCSPLVVFVLLLIDHRLFVDSSVPVLQNPSDEYTKYVPIEELKLPEDQELVVRLPSNSLLKYTSYKDVSILHFDVPPDSRTAFFTFKAFEDPKSAFQRKCKPKDVTLHLKASSYPVISPENITFPKNFFTKDQRFKVYDLQFLSDEQQQRITIEGPHVGNWFAVAFVSWSDPNNDRIEQQGLTASCDTLLSAEMSVSRFRPIIINNGQEHQDNLTSHVLPHIANESNIKEGLNTTRLLRSVPPKQLKLKKPTVVASETLAQVQNTTESHINSTATTANNEITYRFYVPDDIGDATARIIFDQVCDECPPVGFHVRANGYPLGSGTDQSHTHGSIIRPNQTTEISIPFGVQPNTWHYALLTFVNGADETELTTESYNISANHSLSYSLLIDYNTEEPEKTNSSIPNPWEPVKFRHMNFYSLLRQTYREFFMFDYDLRPDVNGTVPETLNLTAQTHSGFAFDVGEVSDIGGTLTFAISMKEAHRASLRMIQPTQSPDLGGILAERLIGDPKEEVVTAIPATSNQSMQIVVCMQLGEPGQPEYPDKCRYGQRLKQASIVVNHTESMGLVHIPFPESGRWYVTMGLFCHGSGTARVSIMESVKEFIRKHQDMLAEMRSPCDCAESVSRYAACIRSPECLGAMNETETLKVKECIMDDKCSSNGKQMTRLFVEHHKAAMEQHVALENCNTSVVFSVSSSPCVAGRCGRFGRCYHYMSGGFVFSTCVCSKGYRGWDCTEDSQVPTNMSILLATLLLTLSNLLFFPSIYMAVKRRYYTEGVIYFFAMFFSIFYHACDAGEDEYSFCLVKIGVLQFCDFYCGLLSIWVTLVAMAHVRPELVSLLHMFGAILLAFGTELNKQSLWVFLAPALTGICLISTSWGLRCAKSRKVFPSRRYLSVWLPFGLTLVVAGLVCYAFLQTKQNYHIVHSIWHMVMAVSILCLLPSRKSFLPKC